MITNIILVMLLTFASTTTEPIIPQPTSAGIDGEWRLLHENIGISPMHMQLLHNDKVVMFDRTDAGPSNISLPFHRCRHDPFDYMLPKDCTAHSILYDIWDNTFRPLSLRTDTWCSSGAVLADGTLVQTGGYNDGDHNVRTLVPCDDGTCDWVESTGYLTEPRWFSTNQLLPDGRVIIVGGRLQFSYEFYPTGSISFYNSSSFLVDFLKNTSDGVRENNFYPFVHLLPDGNLFMFVNVRSVVIDYKQNKVVKHLPPIPGDDPRNYPNSGSSVLLPLDENTLVEPEVMVCGGAPRHAFLDIKRDHIFARAVPTCGRIKPMDENPSWEMESMPIARVMGDMVILPNGDVIIINGAESGTAGWNNARDPVTRPVIYHPNGPPNTRFSVMQPGSRPRLYNSGAILVTDGRVLVSGSNPNPFYNFSNVEYPTELSLEAFLPPYLARENDAIRPEIVSLDGEVMEYKKPLIVTFTVLKYLKLSRVTVRIIAPSFTTHSLGMNQRMVVLKEVGNVSFVNGSFMQTYYNIEVVGPSTAEIAPPGYYLFYVIHAGIPSPGMWVKLQ
ncbi:putative galactose oxidase [Helianthus annuus]|uniref:Galactose oxidase n=1 Tax=Helianthus annuus TaxID=4232 RepID=A0A251RRI9_HELAN|nr:aldehyde oxidase GLOX [Helianthus annuus]KAF5754139.1 putative galactose oxidase [Helianthus annuus]KAJ0432084.1 putative galactose oxidase [Helianthus annuus]KAJ0635228.1 putative galactose oxidase [Helianthus annuus]KAJ0823784.1 putative galactose oxidase [Helianthus annuus]